jgi:hypothetical protein
VGLEQYRTRGGTLSSIRRFINLPETQLSCSETLEPPHTHIIVVERAHPAYRLSVQSHMCRGWGQVSIVRRRHCGGGASDNTHTRSDVAHTTVIRSANAMSLLCSRKNAANLLVNCSCKQALHHSGCACYMLLHPPFRLTFHTTCTTWPW